MADRWWSPPENEHAARALLYRIGAERYRDRVLLGWARVTVTVRITRTGTNLATLPAALDAAHVPAEVCRISPHAASRRGPPLGAAMRAAEDAWIAQGFPLLPEALSAIVEATRGAR